MSRTWTPLGGRRRVSFDLTTITFTITTTTINTMAVIETSCRVPPLRLEATDEMRRCLGTHGPGADVSPSIVHPELP